MSQDGSRHPEALSVSSSGRGRHEFQALTFSDPPETISFRTAYEGDGPFRAVFSRLLNKELVSIASKAPRRASLFRGSVAQSGDCRYRLEGIELAGLTAGVAEA
jgi:hypothetical protein